MSKAKEGDREHILFCLRRYLQYLIDNEQDQRAKEERQSSADRFDEGTYFGGEEEDVLRRVSERFHSQSE